MPPLSQNTPCSFYERMILCWVNVSQGTLLLIWSEVVCAEWHKEFICQLVNVSHHLCSFIQALGGKGGGRAPCNIILNFRTGKNLPSINDRSNINKYLSSPYYGPVCSNIFTCSSSADTMILWDKLYPHFYRWDRERYKLYPQFLQVRQRKVY